MVHYLIHCQQHCLLWGRIKLFLTGMNTAKKRTISIEVGMQNAGLATNLATTTAQFASTPESAIICAVSCVWHSISGTLLAGMFAQYDKIKSGHKETATAK